MGLLKFAFALINPVSRQQAHSTMKVLRSEKGSRLASSRSFAIANENMHHFSIANEEIHAMSSTLHDILANQTDSEKAVKRAMRRYRGSFLSTNSRRQRFARLVLGASVMRRRLWFLLGHSDGDFGCANFTAEHATDMIFAECIDNEVEVRPMLAFELAETGPDASSCAVEVADRVRRGRACLEDWVSTALNESIQDPVAAAAAAAGKLTADEVRARQIGIAFSLPQWLASELVSQHPAGSFQYAVASNSPGPVTLRRNAIRCFDLETLKSRIEKEVVTSAGSGALSVVAGAAGQACGWETGLILTGGRPATLRGLGAWTDGWFEVMDQGSQFIASSVEVQAGDTVLDLCAGNGGKTLALASMLHKQQALQRHKDRDAAQMRGRVLSFDVEVNRLKQLGGSLQRCGIVQESKAHDKNLLEAATIEKEGDANEDTISVKILWPEEQSADELVPAESVDVALVDAPCSSSGVLRRRPGLRWEMDPRCVGLTAAISAGEKGFTDDSCVVDLPPLQRCLLAQAAATVRKGGRLVYATCSILEQENEAVAQWFEGLPSYSTIWEPWPFPDNNGGLPEFESAVALPFIPANCVPVSQIDGAQSYSGGRSAKALPRHWRKLLPHVHGTDGFFIARWRRR
mmetsp:Transcript_48537/g.90424  ORF Transcript_48537/g.90424 Transcript_48537/m.90424 type:complete len:632 (+) Transcript_48537:17-1912(+)